MGSVSPVEQVESSKTHGKVGETNTCCSREVHSALRDDAAHWRASTEYRGLYVLRERVLEVRACNVCTGSITREVDGVAPRLVQLHARWLRAVERVRAWRRARRRRRLQSRLAL